MSKQVTHFAPKQVLKANGKILNISRPVVMGIVNITPDSFFDGGKYRSTKHVLKEIEKKIEQGASIIDIGAASSRPGSEIIDVETELKRLLPVLKTVRNTFPNIFISVDTWRADVAMASAELGADVINDISAGTLDKKMLSTVAETKLPYVFMHMKGIPKLKQKAPVYKNVTKEVLSFLNDRMKEAKKVGIKQLIADPGFGFGKSLNDNYKLLGELEMLKSLKLPLLVGISRKSMICNLLELKPKEALNGTTAANTIALLNGASILRVHDVSEAVEAIKIVSALKF